VRRAESLSIDSTAARAAALTLAVALDAVAFATVLRPRHGYRSAAGLLLALALGVGVALGALATVAAVTALTHRRHGSAWEVTTALPTLGVVVVVFLAVGAGSQIVPALRGPTGQGSSQAAARADFQRWQAAVVPLVVGWMHAIRADAAFTRGLPATGVNELHVRVDRSMRTVDGLVRSLAAASPRLPHRPELRRLTFELEAALAAAQRAQRTYARALAAAARTDHRREADALVYCAGEFNLTPRINGSAGRDHWARSMAVVLAGGGFKSGYIHGATDVQGMAPIGEGCTPDDISATLFHCLGIDPHQELRTPTGRPITRVPVRPHDIVVTG